MRVLVGSFESIPRLSSIWRVRQWSGSQPVPWLTPRVSMPHHLQGSATSVRTPSLKRGLQGGSARVGRMRTALLSHREEGALGSRRNRWV